MVDKPFICSLEHSTTVNGRHLLGVSEMGVKCHFIVSKLTCIDDLHRNRQRAPFASETINYCDEVRKLTLGHLVEEELNLRSWGCCFLFSDFCAGKTGPSLENTAFDFILGT